MDTEGDDQISFDDNGICNYCHHYYEFLAPQIPTIESAQALLSNKIEEIKKEGLGKRYDCMLGLSGGVDSSYLAYLAHSLGLKPLCIHFDNGWNSELAVQNIHHIVNKLGFDLETFVIDWREFRDLQRSYFKAGVIDIEALSDHAIFASIYHCAFRMGIKYILSGSNLVTEGILPRNWTHNKADYINILDIQKKYGTIPLSSYPLIDKKTKNKIKSWGIQTIELLNWIPYRKMEAKETLMRVFDWKDYGGKHHESVFTKFYQCYILPTKFNVDKRKAHLSTLICSGQVTREEALLELAKPLYQAEELKHDKEYVLKKLGFSEAEFEQIMQGDPIPHHSFGVEGSFFEYYPFLKPLRPFWNKFRFISSR